MKKYVFNVEEQENGKLRFSSTNNGFSGFEVLGILERKKQDILDQLSGKIKPETIERKIIKEV